MTRHLGFDIQQDVATVFAGKLWAYTPVALQQGWGLGVAVANEAGYSPISAFHYADPSYDAAYIESVRLNTARRMTEDAALDIVASSMAAGRVSAAQRA